MLLDFDQHATTPLDSRVWEAMQPYFRESYGNPSSLSHRRGLNAAAVELQCRERIACLLNVEPREILWTSGATEANHLAVQGVLRATGPQRGLITVATEHRSILEPARQLRRIGWPVTILGVDSKGLVDLDQLEKAITLQTILVSVMWANNEIGTIAPLSQLAEICRERGVWLHSDATQAVGKLPVDLQATDVDLLSFSGHKIYGPAGIGALIVRRVRGPIPLQPLLEGGGQQNGLRSGTLPLPLLVGLTEALVLCEEARVAEAPRLAELRDRLWCKLAAAIPGLVRHTPVGTGPHPVLPHNLNVGIPGIDGDALLVKLRESNLCVSSGAACSSSNRDPSHVLTAIGVPDQLARASVRFGLGRGTTSEQVTEAAAILTSIVEQIRAGAVAG
jgi:cysteine desulfurase